MVVQLNNIVVMRTKFFLLFFAIFFGCNGENQVNMIVKFHPKAKSEFLNYVDSIRLIPLIVDSNIVFGPDPSLSYYKDELFLFDKNGSSKIFRFTCQGKLLGVIGQRGRGPKEYFNPTNIQLYNDTIYIYSSPKITISKYALNGKFIEKDSILVDSQQSLKNGDEYIGYNGYGMRNYHKFVKVKNNHVTYFQKYTCNVMNFTEKTNVFYTDINNNIFVRETYSNKIFKYSNGSFIDYMIIDFDKYNINSKFFKYDNSFESAEFLLKSEFASITKYFENSNHKVIEVLINKRNPEFYYGIFLKNINKWIWFSMGNFNEHPFANTLIEIYDNKLIFLLDPTLKEFLDSYEINKISNYTSFTHNKDCMYLAVFYLNEK